MRKIGLIFLFFQLLNINNIMAQNINKDCACCEENYNLFDFWIGEWDVYTINEKLVGTNSISKHYDNCVIQEKWVSSGKNRGTSTNFYDKTDNTWNQIWVDNSGYILKLKGKFINGSMILKSDIIKGENNNYFNQIRWTKNNNGYVTQLWETFNEDGTKISEVFRGIYKKKLN